MKMLLANKAVSSFRSELLGNTKKQLFIENSVFYNLDMPKHIFLDIKVIFFQLPN